VLTLEIRGEMHEMTVRVELREVSSTRPQLQRARGSFIFLFGLGRGRACAAAGGKVVLGSLVFWIGNTMGRETCHVCHV
jgi:hypothetical protein